MAMKIKAILMLFVLKAKLLSGSLSDFEWVEGKEEDMFTKCEHTIAFPREVNGETTWEDTPIRGVSAGDTSVMMFGTTLVMFQTPAMGIAQAGMIRRKNSLSMMMQCVAGMSVGSLLWMVVGYSMVFGPSKAGGLIGNPATFFFFRQMPTNGVDCLSIAPSIPGTLFASFQMMFALMVPVIITGAWAEKLTMKAFFIFMVMWPLLVYYPVAHWVWGGGWLAALGTTDFAGGVTIHTVAGVAALVVSLCLQKRRNMEKLQMTSHNIPLLVIGGTIIWAGWYSFNGCSALSAGATASLALLNTHISASISGLTWMLLTYRSDKCFHLTDVMNGSFAGLAGITPGSGYVAAQDAVCIGLLIGLASWHTCKLLKSSYIYVDDVLDCFSLQAIPGGLGSILLGFFRRDSGEYGYSKDDDPDGKTLGLFYGGNGELLAAQIIAVVMASILSAVSTFVVMMTIKHTVGIDLTFEEEQAGLDKSQIGEVGYDTVPALNEELMDNEDLTAQLVEAAAMGNLGKCKHLLKAGANVARGDYDHRTPLHLASAEGRVELCKWLVEKNADVNYVDNFGRTPLEDAVLNSQEAVCAYLQSQNAKMDDARVLGLLCEAAFDGDVVQCAKLAHRVSAAVREKDYDGRTALHVAVCSKNEAVAKFLLAKGADPKCKDRWGDTAIDNAQFLKLDDLLHYLDGRKVPTADVDLAPKHAAKEPAALNQIVPSSPGTDNMTANMELMKVAASGNLSDLKNLMEKGADPNQADYDKRTPLHIACASGHAKVAKHLVKDKRVNINAVDRFKVTPLADALKNKSKELVEILKKNGATVANSGYGFVLCGAAAKGDIAKLEELYDSGVDLATADYDGRTALHLACCNGHVEAVEFLTQHLEKHALNVLDRIHNTPLDDAKNNKQHECAQILTAAGATSRQCDDTVMPKKSLQ